MFLELSCSLVLVLSAAGDGKLPASLVLGQKQKVLFLGDSITQDAFKTGGYIWWMQTALKLAYPDLNLTFLDASRRGDHVTDMARRFDKTVLSEKPNWIVIFTGMNDVWDGFDSGHPEGNGDKGTMLADFKAKLAEIVKAGLKGGAQVVVCTTTVLTEDLEGVENELVDKYNDALANGGGRAQVPAARFQQGLPRDPKHARVSRGEDRRQVPHAGRHAPQRARQRAARRGGSARFRDAAGGPRSRARGRQENKPVSDPRMRTPDLLTVAEQSKYQATSRHAQVQSFIAELARRTRLARVRSMGKSGEGQDIPVLVLSRAGRFTPAAAHASGKPVVLILANIHAGEVEGKECVLMLARDLTLGPLQRLLDGVTLVLVPNYNPDGNDRIDPAHRRLDLRALEGQIGPASGVGTRNTGRGHNLNRDYVKLESPEARALSRLFGQWRPHLTVDCHATNGSIHGYHLTFDTAHLVGDGAARADPVRARHPAARDLEVAREAHRAAHLLLRQLPRPEGSDAGRGRPIRACPRFGSHYRGLTGRMDVLLEAYSYISFEERCRVMYGILREIIEYAGTHGREMVSIVARAERDTIARGERPAPDDWVGINYAQVGRKRARRHRAVLPDPSARRSDRHRGVGPSLAARTQGPGAQAHALSHDALRPLRPHAQRAKAVGLPDPPIGGPASPSISSSTTCA
jgi:lysophospholipase L1-like esterase